MKWSLKVAKIAGIRIYIHWTFVFIIGYAVMLHSRPGDTLATAGKGVLFVLAVFLCVLLHELGHALTARKFGILTRDITLLPIGGVARLERMPREPAQELLVAAAGPAVNVVIAGLLWVAMQIFYGTVDLTHAFDAKGNFWAQLLITNIALVVFNMVPAFPMDGGRILRALLATRLNYARATAVAARIGQTLAVCFGILGLLQTDVIWVLIAMFVFIGAEAELQMVQVTSTFRDLRVRDAMMTNFRALSPQDTLSRAASELLAGSQHDFPITANDAVVGLLTRQDLVKGLAERGAETAVGEVMRPNCRLIDESEFVEKCYELLRQNNCSSLPVVRNGQLVGLITLENITEWIMLNNALHTPRS